MSQPINYKEGVIPTFEEFINSSHSGKVFEYIEGDEKSMKNYEYNPADHKFETLGEFKFYLSCGQTSGLNIMVSTMVLKVIIIILRYGFTIKKI